jgi:copper chaperone CopZ
MKRSQILIVIGVLAMVCILVGFNSFAASLKQTTLNVSNLSCGSCLSRIDDALRDYTGYSKLDADLRQGIVIVEHEASLEEQTIAKTISDIGYPAKVVGGKNASVTSDPSSGGNTRYGCCSGGARNSGCSASASTWKRLFNRQQGASPAE